MLARILAEARRSSGLDPALFSRLVDIDEPRLQALESGAAEPTPSEVDRWALTLGLRVRDLLGGR